MKETKGQIPWQVKEQMKPIPNAVDTTTPVKLRQTGAKLSKVTQSLVYKAIRTIDLEKKFKTRTRTEVNIEHIKDCAEEIFGKRPTTKKIWTKIRNKDLLRQAKYFLWMTIHNAYMVGNHCKGRTTEMN